jgi:hypothetical protein
MSSRHLSATDMDDDGGKIESDLYAWACGYFSQSLLLVCVCLCLCLCVSRHGDAPTKK